MTIYDHRLWLYMTIYCFYDYIWFNKLDARFHMPCHLAYITKHFSLVGISTCWSNCVGPIPTEPRRQDVPKHYRWSDFADLNFKFSEKEASYSFLKSRKHKFQIQNLVHLYFVWWMKQTVWYRTVFWESETATKKCVTVVAMTTKTFQNGC